MIGLCHFHGFLGDLLENTHDNAHTRIYGGGDGEGKYLFDDGWTFKVSFKVSLNVYANELSWKIRAVYE